MRRAAVALRALVLRIASAIGLEGVFLSIGTCALAVASSYISAAGPWLVIGVMSILAGLALALPTRKG